MGTLSVWYELGNSGEYRSKFKLRYAFRTKIVDGKAIGWHLLWDSYPALKDTRLAEEQPGTRLAEDQPVSWKNIDMRKSIDMTVGAALMGLGFFIARITHVRRRNVLLEDAACPGRVQDWSPNSARV